MRALKLLKIDKCKCGMIKVKGYRCTNNKCIKE